MTRERMKEIENREETVEFFKRVAKAQQKSRAWKPTIEKHPFVNYTLTLTDCEYGKAVEWLAEIDDELDLVENGDGTYTLNDKSEGRSKDFQTVASAVEFAAYIMQLQTP